LFEALEVAEKCIGYSVVAYIVVLSTGENVKVPKKHMKSSEWYDRIIKEKKHVAISSYGKWVDGSKLGRKNRLPTSRVFSCYPVLEYKNLGDEFGTLGNPIR